MVVPPKQSFLVRKPMVVGYHHFRKPPDDFSCCFFLKKSKPANLPQPQIFCWVIDWWRYWMMVRLDDVSPGILRNFSANFMAFVEWEINIFWEWYLPIGDFLSGSFKCLLVFLQKTKKCRADCNKTLFRSCSEAVQQMAEDIQYDCA